MNSDENHLPLTNEIVSIYVAHHKLDAGQLPDLIITVHQAISHLGQPAEPEEARILLYRCGDLCSMTL